ncbi:hypothetical protein ABK040_006709 [Willaertia magna]
MLKQAEQMKGEDDELRKKIEAKNHLESYAYQMKSTVEDPNLAGKISDSDKEVIKKSCEEAISWIDDHPSATKEEYEGKQKELEGKCAPIITKLYQGAGGGAGGMPNMGGMGGGFPGGGFPGAGATGGEEQTSSTTQPKFEDVDVD